MENIIKRLEDELRCFICKSIFSIPKFLNCHHTFCLKCIWDNKEKVECKICNFTTPLSSSGVEGLITNQMVEHFSTILKVSATTTPLFRQKFKKKLRTM